MTYKRTALLKPLFLSLMLTTGAVSAQEVIILKVSHFLPAASNAQAKLIEPWCAKVNTESNGRLKCQIYPSMQLGGTPPQ